MMDIDTHYSLRHRNKLYCEYNTSGVFSSLETLKEILENTIYNRFGW
ncbi:hypothetical protein HanPSC8_Chr06g0244141 [Helianthus annuus]|nr:hypothetical protein HanPSC8_Chr06g0244141 [Helianthus annuus]